MFAGLNLNKLALVGFKGADTVANVIAHYNETIKETFFALCYGNLWSEEAFYKAKEYDVTLYHGAEDNLTIQKKVHLQMKPIASM